jgi:hypothetical protein
VSVVMVFVLVASCWVVETRSCSCLAGLTTPPAASRTRAILIILSTIAAMAFRSV